MVTPAMRRFAGMTLNDLKELSKNPGHLSVAEAIALTTLIDALTTGSFSTGAKSREQVFNRIDGDPESKANVNNGIQIIVREYVGLDGNG